MNSTKEQYGEQSLENCLNSTDHQCNLSTLLEGVSKFLVEHVQDVEQSDDVGCTLYRASKFLSCTNRLCDMIAKSF